jgi:hypothetical protein
MATVTGFFSNAGIGAASIPYPVKASTLAAKVLTSDGVSNDYDAVTVGATGTSSRIHVTGITNAVPALATINSITITINRYNDQVATSVTDSEVKLIRAGTVESTNKATGTQYPAALAVATYGGDLWGASWTAADINDSGFGVAFCAAIQDYSPGDLFGGLARYDYVAYSIDYTDYVAPVSVTHIDEHYYDGSTYHRANECFCASEGNLIPNPYAGLPTEAIDRDLVADAILKYTDPLDEIND